MNGQFVVVGQESSCKRCGSVIHVEQQAITDETEYGPALFCCGGCHKRYMQNHPVKASPRKDGVRWN
jgi:cytochrome c553